MNRTEAQVAYMAGKEVRHQSWGVMKKIRRTPDGLLQYWSPYREEWSCTDWGVYVIDLFGNDATYADGWEIYEEEPQGRTYNE